MTTISITVNGTSLRLTPTPNIIQVGRTRSIPVTKVQKNGDHINLGMCDLDVVSQTIKIGDIVHSIIK
jgi:hypothetical protein